MMISREFDQANRISREKRAIKKIDQLLNRINVTVNDIISDPLLNEKSTKKILKHMRSKIQKL